MSTLHGSTRALWGVGLALLLGCQADGPSVADPAPAPGQAGATLQLAVVQQDGGSVVVEVSYHPDADAERPRVAELWLGHSPSLKLLASEARDAVTAAGKTLVVQDKGEEGLRTIVYSSSNLDRVQGGAIARYQFLVEGPGPHWVDLLERMPLFAPMEANIGIMLPARLAIGESP
jgi:hypothetical protein